ncbi:MAG: phytanoyl-CoA dioxygenase family protein [Actinomycetota bacterium]
MADTNTDTDTKRTRLAPEIAELGLEEYVLQLEVDGLAVVPPEVHGVPEERLELLATLLLDRAEEIVGCPFHLESGPAEEVVFHNPDHVLAELAGERTPGEPSQFLIQQLCSLNRVFRDLAVNPVAVALIRHMIGANATRFSSHNAFVKWQGNYGYGPNLGLHCDQLAVPLPWGRNALTANTNWCLTEYTREGGALAYVPGSHRRMSPPTFPDAVRRAVPCEAPKGSLIVFHGATWHGAFPKETPGMRLMISNYYRHLMVLPQEEFRNNFDRSLADDCDDPELFRTLCGFTDEFPYVAQGERVPRAVGR